MYLGHRVDSEGLHTLDNKVTAVLKAPSPKDVQELRSFLGLIHYYGKVLSNLSTLLHPLNELLKADKTWEWSTACEAAFTEAKRLLASAPVLAHYNPSLPIRLAGDASAYGIGAVISHVLPDGTERPVAYTSRTLTSTERNYSQLEKEALSLIYGVQKFHQYLRIWTTVCLSYRSQTTNYYTRTQERNTTLSCCKTTTLGLHTLCVLIYY